MRRQSIPTPTLRVRCLAATATLVATLAGAQDRPVDERLYHAWGRTDGIRAVMADFVVRLQADRRIGPFFRDVNRQHLVAQLTDQLCQAAGGPCTYEGAPMGPVHAGMAIGKGDFNALVEVLQQSMDAQGIPFAAQNAMLARLAPLHRDIVSRE